MPEPVSKEEKAKLPQPVAKPPVARAPAEAPPSATPQPQPQPQPRLASPPPAIAPPRVAVAPTPQSVLFLVRDNVHRAQDLQGRKVALGQGGATADDLRGVVQANAGVTVDPVNISWTAGLRSLATGEVDGVLLSVGPTISEEEKTSIALGSYKLLEIPIEPAVQ